MSSALHASMDDLNSTNGRTNVRIPKAVTYGFRGLAALSPGQAERLAAWLFCHPHRTALRPREAAILDAGTRFEVRAGGQDLAAWSWGEGPTVLLHHGWSGRAAQMTAFVDPLVRGGFRVVAYDAPAHGASPGRLTGLPVFAETMRELANRESVQAVVAHSIGCAATMLAIRQGLSVDRAVFLAPPANMRVFLSVFADAFAMSERVRGGMARRIASEFDIDWAEMDALHWAGRERPPLLVFHDREDETVPWAHGKVVREVWHDADLVTTEGLGHQRIRRDPAVIEQAVGFLRHPDLQVSPTQPRLAATAGAAFGESSESSSHPPEAAQFG